MIREFTDLISWQAAHQLLLMVYKIAKNFPKEEMFGLKSQMQRAALSVTSNIAEGFGRRGYKERIQFYYLAQGSLTEVKNQAIAARDIGYLSKEGYNELLAQSNMAHKLLQGLISKSKTFLS